MSAVIFHLGGHSFRDVGVGVLVRDDDDFPLTHHLGPPAGVRVLVGLCACV